MKEIEQRRYHTPNLCDIDSARALRLDRNSVVPVTGIEGYKSEWSILISSSGSHVYLQARHRTRPILSQSPLLYQTSDPSGVLLVDCFVCCAYPHHIRTRPAGDMHDDSWKPSVLIRGEVTGDNFDHPWRQIKVRSRFNLRPRHNFHG